MDAGPRRLHLISILTWYKMVMAVSMGCQEARDGYTA